MKNLLKAGRSLQWKWQEDPVAVTRYVFKRFGGPRSRKFLAAAGGSVLVPAGSPLAAHLAFLAGNHQGVDDHLAAALLRAHRSGAAKHLADIALAAGKPEIAARFLQMISRTASGTELTRARILWHEGHMSDAIATLSSPSPRSLRLGAAYGAERDVYSGWRPHLPLKASYSSRPNVVVHLVTNSLPHTQTGYTQRTQSMLSAQAEAGWEVHAATRLGFPWAQGVSGAAASETVGNVTYHRLCLQGRLPNHRDRLQLEAERLLEVVVELRPQILHTTTHFVNALVVEAVAAAVGIPWAYEVRGQLADTWASKRGTGASETERYTAWNLREDEAMRRASLVLTLGEAMRGRVATAGVDPNAIVMVPNAVGREYLRNVLDSASARVALGLPAQGTYIGTVSSIVEYEGLDVLVEAFASLQRDHPDVRLLIVGDGSELPRLRQRIQELGLEGKAHFPGRVPREHAVRYHEALDVFVVPRKEYAVTRSVTPLKPVEAMAMSRPVVASDLPALREIVSDGETGLLARAGDPADLAEAIGRLLDSPARRTELGQRGRQAVLAARTWDGNAKKTLEGYQRLLSTGQSGSSPAPTGHERLPTAGE